MNLPLISVIVPVYNGENYLGECIESIRNQTYERLEIIIVNDGSTDSTYRIAKSLAEEDGRIKYFKKENGGVSSARNLGLSVVTGELIGFVDSDDAILSDMYEYLYTQMEKHAADIVQCAMIYESSCGKSIVCSPKEDISLPAKEALANKVFADAFSFGSCSKLFRRSAVENVRFDESYVIGEDLRYNLDAMRGAGRAVLLTEAKYRYIQRETGATGSVPSLRSLRSFFDMANKAENDFSDLPKVQEFIKTEGLRIALDSCSKIARFSPEGSKELFKELRQRIKEELGFISRNPRFDKKERFKFSLISKFPALYRFMIKNKRGSL